MKRDLIRDPSVFYIGKGIIIMGILVISSLSFTLGYFVGKSIQPPVVSKTSVITRQESTEQKNIDPEKKEAVVQEPIQETQQIAKIQQPQNQQTKEAEKTKETPKTRKYTVQAGVFKDASVAEALKSKLDKKGYRTYIIPFETKRHKKLYKVMVGEFSTRKEAEVLSIKIKNAESLQTFVTFNTEKEELR